MDYRGVPIDNDTSFDDCKESCQCFSGVMHCLWAIWRLRNIEPAKEPFVRYKRLDADTERDLAGLFRFRG